MNLVFIVLDTVRKDKISAYNADIDFTGTLEEFSKESMVFTDAISQAPWTLPSHASMFTGLYPWEHEATQKQLYMEVDRPTLAEKFKDGGYKTACYTSNTWISSYTGMTDGFEDSSNFFSVLPDDMASRKIQKAWQFINQGRRRYVLEKVMDVGEYFHRNSDHESNTPRIIKNSEKFVKSNKDENFFLFVNFMDAHMPHHPPKEYLEKHAPDVDPDEVCQRAYNHNAGVDEVDFEAAKALYNADMDYLDDKLEEFFQIFRREGLEDDTVFVVVSDHGENLGEKDMYGHQFSVSEQLVSVPLMIKAPGIEDEEFEGQFELRQLYELLPSLVFEDEFNPEADEDAFGGYEYPKLDLRNVPSDKVDEMGKKLRFIRNSGKSGKAVQRGEEYYKVDLETGNETELEDAYKKKLDNIEEAAEGKMLEDQDEKVKKRLEDLGYI